MGMTPLDGLVMGTRSGDLDPAIVSVIATKEGLSVSQTEALLNTQSGLLGLSGVGDADQVDSADEGVGGVVWDPTAAGEIDVEPGVS